MVKDPFISLKTTIDAGSLEGRENVFPICGYAPGSYLARCRKCEKQMMNVDKYASRCLPCAIEDANGIIASQSEMIREYTAELGTLKEGARAIKKLFDGI